MPPRKSPTLTEAELRLMDVLWENGPGTVHQLLEALPGKPALAYNSVLTTIRILEKKGYVQHLKDGRAHVYQAVIGRKEATRSEVRNLVGRFFKNSHELLLLNLLEDRSLDAQDLMRLRDLLQGDRVSAVAPEEAQEKGEKS
ncbi:MAG TPA: BlaI/MecI/CopY family transcriptional regulator [Terriglobales bacterium]